jgi:predicted nucleic acid-binding protein
VIYLDTSVALAHLLAEDRQPPIRLWQEELVSSRLLQYELWTRLNARGLAQSHREAALELESRISFLELVPPVLQRALEPFPVPMRTLDALHLASAVFLKSQVKRVQLASYDERQLRAATALDIPAWESFGK